MTTLMEASQITVTEEQLRLSEAEATATLRRIAGRPALQARHRLRFGPGSTCEQLARVLDKALVRAEESGLDPARLVVSGGSAVSADDIVRIRRKAHGLADWISSPTSDVTVVLRPQGLAELDESSYDAPAPTAREPVVRRPETEDELAIREALYDVIDPDLGVNVVDLGFVRQVALDDAGVATLTMTLTSAACPLTPVMERNVAAALFDSGQQYVIDWEWLPAWKPADITPDGREQLQAIGFNSF
jgi:metal-sulfur cluster biosynthetic enzyme/ribosomal protein L22